MLTRAVGVFRSARTQERQQRGVHHLMLAGAGDEAGPAVGDLGVQGLQARARLIQQLGVDAVSAGMRGHGRGRGHPGLIGLSAAGGSLGLELRCRGQGRTAHSQDY